MSIYGMMRTSVAGMAAQSERVAMISDNVANISTAGYKRIQSEFSQIVVDNTAANYVSGSVGVTEMRELTRSGARVVTGQSGHLAIDGPGFFLVGRGELTGALTRSGNFAPDGEGKLVNAGGYRLLGLKLGRDGSVSSPELVDVDVTSDGMTAEATTNLGLVVNLPFESTAVVDGNLPSANGVDPAFASRTTLRAYGQLGQVISLDTYFTKTSDNTWEIAVYDRVDASDNGGFPYKSGPRLVGQLEIDSANGGLVSSGEYVIALDGGQSVALSIKGSTQLAGGFRVLDTSLNGRASGNISKFDISADGTVELVTDSGEKSPIYRIPLGIVAGPDRIQAISGDAYIATKESGAVQVVQSGTQGAGFMVPGAVEQSNVELADELTDLIGAQRDYTANSRVFQTGADLMDVLISLKR